MASQSLKAADTCAPEPLGRTLSMRPADPRERPSRLLLFLPDGRALRLDRQITIGQSLKCELTLADERVSRQHCVIELVDQRPVLRDLGSTNGTFVNGVRVTVAELDAGAVLVLGATRLAVGLEARTHRLLGETACMIRLRHEISILAANDLSVLVLGETGTGKELVAHALHEQSGRRGELIALNCGSVPKDLIESELFGHERGAFTGAAGRRLGLFQQADGGTLFLDEIGELPLPLQSRLLRALESGRVRPVGANHELPVRVRVVAATHVDLARAVERGRFRQDLYYRLAGAVLQIPALRLRKTDIPRLAEHLMLEILPGGHLAKSALDALCEHSWPGNVRELKNVLRAAAAFHGPLIVAEHLDLRDPVIRRDVDSDENNIRLDDRAFTDIERDVLIKTISRHGGNKRAAALALRIPKSTLCDKARRYGIGGD